MLRALLLRAIEPRREDALAAGEAGSLHSERRGTGFSVHAADWAAQPQLTVLGMLGARLPLLRLRLGSSPCAARSCAASSSVHRTFRG